MDEDTTTSPPFWTSENQYDQVDVVLKREIFALFKMVYPAVLLVAGGITVLGFIVPILILLSIMQYNVMRIVEDMEERDESGTEMLQQPLERSDEWQNELPPQDN